MAGEGERGRHGSGVTASTPAGRWERAGKLVGAVNAVSKQKMWLEAFSDNMTGLESNGRLLAMCDLFGDNDYRLVVGTTHKKLKVYRGTMMAAENQLVDVPSAIATFVVAEPGPSGMAGRALPNLAVAVGPNVFIYRRMRPYFKFTVPVQAPSEEEKSAWEALESGQATLEDCISTLRELVGSRRVTLKTQELVALEDPTAQQEYVEKMSGVPLQFPSASVAAMTDVQTSQAEATSESQLVLGTEDGRVLLLDRTGSAAVVDRLVAPSPAAILGSTGTLSGQPHVVYLSRAGHAIVLSGQGLQSQSSSVSLPAPPVSLVVLKDAYTVACMDESVTCYDLVGAKRYSFYTNSPVLSISAVPITAVGGLTRHITDAGVVAACADKTLRVYRKGDLVSEEALPCAARAIAFGRYGREDSTLVCILSNGGLHIKFMPRNNPLVSGHVHTSVENVKPLEIPKKTKVFVELTQREREAAVEMHRLFQRDLCKLRLTAARTFFKLLNDGKGTVSYGAGASLRINANVMGLGPAFVVALVLQNTGEKTVRSLHMAINYDAAVYDVAPSVIPVPLLVPGSLYTFEVDVRALEPAAPPKDLGIVVVSPSVCSPVLSVVAKMPPSELLEGD